MKMRRVTGTIILILACVTFAGPVAADDGFQPGVDLPGFVYRNFDMPRPRPRLCQVACQNDGQCRAWTFVRVGVIGRLASCWLKSDVPQPRPDSCCVSGVQ
jgi:hypothetical protein